MVSREFKKKKFLTVDEMNEGKGNEQKEAPMVDCKRYTWNLGTLKH